MQFAGNWVAFHCSAVTQRLGAWEFRDFAGGSDCAACVPGFCVACVKNDQTGERGKNGGSKASQHALSMPDALFEIEVPHRLLGRLVFGFLEGFLEFAIEDVFLLAFGFPGIAELVLALRACSARMRAASLISTSGAAFAGATCESTTESSGSTVSFDWQHGQVTSIGGADFFAMPLFYARNGSDEHGMR